MILEIVTSIIERLKGAAVQVEGLVLAGGCALNVGANQRLHDMLHNGNASNDSTSWMNSYLLDLFVPSAPGDHGLTVGALWAATPPAARQPLQYLGFRLFDEWILDGEAQRRGAVRLSELGGVEYLADLFVGGPAWQAEQNRNSTEKPEKPIIAIVRGRQEFGPRALGHRSLLAVPVSSGMRDRMNRVKFRQWYRPVAPMIADEALEQVFGSCVKSPYMTMAPLVAQPVKDDFPAIAHFDGTARHQSVGKVDEPWLHALLLAVGRRIGVSMLINTSFNSRGEPIVNTVRATLAMLDELADLDYVLVNDWLFRPR